MALIERFQTSGRKTFKPHPTSVVCHYKAFGENGAKILQLDTGGSAARKNPGKQSQTLQLDSRRAKQLWDLLGKEFGFGR